MTYRVYHNNGDDFPYSWSIDEGSSESEQTVLAVFIFPPAVATSQFNGKQPSKDSPVAWFDVSGELEVKDGFAYFS